MNKAHIEWCKELFGTIKQGGVWGIPRSGMLFRKIGDELVLCECMPHEEGMPITAAQLQEQQECEFETVKRHFGAAGITVRKAH